MAEKEKPKPRKAFELFREIVKAKSTEKKAGA